EGQTVDRTQARHDRVAPLSEDAYHLVDGHLDGSVIFERAGRGALRDRRRVACQMALQCRGNLDQSWRPNEPPQAPAGHGVCLRNTVDNEAAVGELWRSSKPAADRYVADARVYLVDDRGDLVLREYFGERDELCIRVHGTGR